MRSIGLSTGLENDLISSVDTYVSGLELSTDSISAAMVENSSSESFRFPMDLLRQSLNTLMSLS